jgi:hypothetical protein
VRSLATPTAIQFGEDLRGRSLAAILNDDAIDMAHRTILWGQFQELLTGLASRLPVEATVLDGIGMNFEFRDGTEFSVTIGGTLIDPATEEFVILDPMRPD